MPIGADGGTVPTTPAATESRQRRQSITPRRSWSAPAPATSSALTATQEADPGFTPQVATDMTTMMSKVVEEGTERATWMASRQPETGTTNAYRDAWFIDSPATTSPASGTA
jgi:membrane peptidoglycan carboxypeptidase